MIAAKATRDVKFNGGSSYRIAGNFRMVLIFVYFVCSIPYTKIKTVKI